jgi:hypothetical protein
MRLSEAPLAQLAMGNGCSGERHCETRQSKWPKWAVVGPARSPESEQKPRLLVGKAVGMGPRYAGKAVRRARSAVSVRTRPRQRDYTRVCDRRGRFSRRPHTTTRLISPGTKSPQGHRPIKDDWEPRCAPEPLAVHPVGPFGARLLVSCVDLVSQGTAHRSRSLAQAGVVAAALTLERTHRAFGAINDSSRTTIRHPGARIQNLRTVFRTLASS